MPSLSQSDNTIKGNSHLLELPVNNIENTWVKRWNQKIDQKWSYTDKIILFSMKDYYT